MQCPSSKCQSSNVQFLPHYWESLPGDSPLKTKYARPALPDQRARLTALAVAAVGLAVTFTGSISGGLLLLAAGIAGVLVTSRRITAAETARARWESQRICLACTEQWVP